MKRKKSSASLICRIALMLAASAAMNRTFAQDTKPTDEKVQTLDPFKVVNDGSYVATNAIGATRIASPIQDLPISVAIITDGFMRDRDVQKIEDAVIYTSGMGNVNRNDGGTRNENFAIRGFNSSLTLRNGIPYNVFSDSANIDQIEVVKGANSVLYGVNSPGGLVNFVTKQPTSYPVAEVRVTDGSFSFRRGEVDLGGPIGSPAFRYRLDMAQENTQGPLRNAISHMSFVDPVVSFDVFPQTTVTVDYERRELTGRMQRDAYPQLRHDTSGVRDGYANGGRYYSNIFPDDDNTYMTENLEVRLQQRFGDNVTLRVVGADTKSTQDSFNMIGALMVVGSPTMLVRQNLLELNTIENRTAFADLAATFSVGPTSHRLVTGAQWTEKTTVGYGEVGAPAPAVNINDPSPTYFRPETKQQLLNNLTAADGSATEIITKSVFLIDQIAMWENRVHFLLGARYDDLGKANGGTNTTPQVGVTYTVHPGVNVYATFSESYVPNPPEVLNGHFPNVVSYFPADTGKGYEAGVKFDLDNSKLSATAAFFSVTRSNVLETEANAADALVTDAILSGEQKSDGVELDVTGQVTPEYSIVASYSHTLARITKDDVSPDQVGLRLEGVAPNQAALWNNYRFAPGPLKGWSAGAGLLWREGPIQHLVIRAGEAINQGTYTTVEAALAYEFKSFGHEWRLALNVHNLTDADYFDRRSQKALPRDFLVSVSTKF